MSDYGLIVKTPSGGIQIDSTYRNYCRQSEGTSAISNDNTSTGYFTIINITASPLVPLMLIRPNTDYFVVIKTYQKTGDNYDGIAIVTEENVSTTIDWKLYRETYETSLENYGFRVWNPNSKLVFDSGKSYFKIHAVESITLANPDPNNPPYPYIDIVHADISDPFYILSPGSCYVETTGTDPEREVSYLDYSAIGMKKLSATSIRIGWFMAYAWVIGTADPITPGVWNPTQKLIICKV